MGIRMSNSKILRLCALYAIFFISNFNSLIQIFIPRIFFTAVCDALMMIAVLADCIESGLAISKTSFSAHGSVLVYFAWCCARFLIQFLTGKTTSISATNFAQTVVPILVCLLPDKLDEESIVKIEKFYVLCAAVSVAMGWINQLFQFLPSSVFNNELVITGSTVNSRAYSMAGYSLGTGWICGISTALLVKNKIRYRKAMWIMLISIMIIAAVRTYSRAGVFFVFFIIFFSNTVQKINCYVKTMTVFYCIVAAWILILLLLIYWDRIVQSTFFTRYVLNAFESSGSIRDEFHHRALELIKEDPILGTGFGYVGSTAYTSNIGRGFPPENGFYLIAINSGLIGLFLFVIVNLKATYRIIKNRDK